MPKIRPVSDLRNYNEVLREITVDEPVFLTKNGRGRYAIVDIDEYEKTMELLGAVKEMLENNPEIASADGVRKLLASDKK
ncbi:MAG: type II toxin-antitoxin system Phd/YefM family antitoxin [Clostridia bacterium]|nr:type II toxin-antitoxin system Phd/YefM family antitoxin [Clostridia bacterium]